MKERIQYFSIKDTVLYSFEEYINFEGYNVSQVAGKILEEDWREVNYNLFTKASYILNIAIESLKRGQIADFIVEKIEQLVLVNIDEFANEETMMYQQDLRALQELLKSTKYEVITNTFSSKMRIDYLLNIRN